ncbi:hypothetical protein K3U93_24095 [Mycobacterium malmoense]|uniref:Uncharacterized protein n=1 Tax=Mycobacterium malmoense TaxID=1780 RepID=A0ABX3SLT0_MYCMA|nr:hypothetical protein [Mycobacterium malmoense]OIN80550.1 hypothetical protein BMG05_12400 [Mycobacterium malmoense]ORA78647.1 hypothetical protein BST29_21115 [Mycobacterium malmoense]QZA17596.1 hypothetical protein K3U93_24095 [Mycobacterium malmoense]UNB94379.1 hypothetical protein H5T25_24080 [Mycobacterium malmoense]
MDIELPRGEGPRAPLKPPTDAGYLLLAARTQRRPPFLPGGRGKRVLIESITPKLAELAGVNTVIAADLFVARLVAPGMGHELLRRRAIRPARFDVVLLVRTADPAGALALRDNPLYRRLRAEMGATALDTYEVAARNVRRIADVRPNRSSVFLFNYFYADDPRRLIPVWEYTAGWFVQNTALPDSEVMAPLDGERADYGIVNHASWPHWRTFLPQLALRPSFRRFVLATFAANNIAAQPILYRLTATHSRARRV